MTTLMVIDENYQVLKILSENGFNQICLCHDLKKEEFCVVKFSKSNSIIDMDLIQKQAKYNILIESEYTVKLLNLKIGGYYNYNKKVEACNFIVMEYASKGEIFDYVKLNKGLYYKVSLYYFRKLILGLEEIHSLNVCHRDIKIDNLLLDENFNLKICDFEFCEQIFTEKNDYINHFDKQGTMSYMAPEFFYHRNLENKCKIFHHGDKVDIYAAGVVLFVLLTGTLPFKMAEVTDCSYNKFLNKKEIFWSQKSSSNFSQSAKDILEKLLHHDPSKRITINEIKEHKFFNEILPTPKDVADYMNNIWLMISQCKKIQ